MSDSKKNSRRNFIKNTTLGAAGFMIVPRHVIGGPGFLAPSDRLIVAGVGVGGKGRSDLANFHESGKADIGFLCDVDDRMAETSVKAFPKAKYYKDWREMFDKESKNFDAVSVSTPDHTHAEYIEAGVEAGLDVISEKPMTATAEQAAGILRIADRGRIRVTGRGRHLERAMAR